MMKPMTIRGYAAHRKCSRQAVEKALAAGRITAIEGPRGRLIDPVAADKAWHDNTDPLRGGPMSGYGAAVKDSLPAASSAPAHDTVTAMAVITGLRDLIGEMIEAATETDGEGAAMAPAGLVMPLVALALVNDPDPTRAMLRDAISRAARACIDIEAIRVAELAA